jgi:aspartate/glutamate racemase
MKTTTSATYFWSGSNRAGEIDALAANGQEIGVAVDALDKAGDGERALCALGAERPLERIVVNVAQARGGKPILMFDRALNTIRQRYDPDVVLIACNTLSVLYEDTPFAAEASIPVIGIVQGGVELIAGCLSADSTCKVIIFGTETTIDEGAHLAGLAELGSPLEQVVTQSCPQLAAYIEQDVDGAATGLLVDAYVTEALAAAGDDSADIYVSLNCTHYAYALDAWRRAFANHGITVSGFLDPNSTMADSILVAGRRGRYPAVGVRVSVVSMIKIPDEAIASIGGCLKEVSPATEEALKHYELRPDLFEWQDLFSVEDLR